MARITKKLIADKTDCIKVNKTIPFEFDYYAYINEIRFETNKSKVWANLNDGFNTAKVIGMAHTKKEFVNCIHFYLKS
jgi:hypothetical protein